MNSLNNDMYNWSIDFDRLFENGKQLLLPRLREFFKNLMDNTSIIEQYKLSYKVNGSWHTKPLSPELMDQLFNDLTEENFIFNINEKPPEYYYDSNNKDKYELPNWSLFSSIAFTPNLTYNGETKNIRVGSSFKYIVSK